MDTGANSVKETRGIGAARAVDGPWGRAANGSYLHLTPEVDAGQSNAGRTGQTNAGQTDP